MNKLNRQDLKTLREDLKNETESIKIIVGMSSCGIGAGADNVFEKIKTELKSKNLNNVELKMSGCIGLCYSEPNVEVLMPNEKRVIYGLVDTECAKKIIEEHILQGRIVESNVVKENIPEKTCLESPKHQHSNKQKRIVLRNCGIIDPEDINDYIKNSGYKALEKVLFEMTPSEVIDELKLSQIRGRGGAGFPTWKKWLFSKDVQSEEKYIICNADEGDPGAYMDRGTLEGDPHSILEAMSIAAHTTGAQKGIIYVRIEYPLAIKRLKIALKQSYEKGLLGKKILGTDFNFDIELRYGAGAFVCGEETALIKSAEGCRGMPIPRPPYPAVNGLWHKPTIINNVETLANIPVIILNGGKWFSEIGTETSKGTKVFALTGKVNKPRLLEVVMGTTLREIIYELGGGILNGLKIKAAQTGGPSGGLIPEKYLDTPIDYDNLQQLGSIMGSGGLIVIDESDCIIDVIKFYLQFSVDESCGKCAPCRIGSKTLYNLIEKITSGNGSLSDIKKIETIANTMKKASMWSWSVYSKPCNICFKTL